MPSLLHASEIVAAIADAPPPRTPPPGASALERLRRKLPQPLDPRDPLTSLAPFTATLRLASEDGRPVLSLEHPEPPPQTPPAPPRTPAPLPTIPRRPAPP